MAFPLGGLLQRGYACDCSASVARTKESMDLLNILLPAAPNVDVGIKRN